MTGLQQYGRNEAQPWSLDTTLQCVQLLPCMGFLHACLSASCYLLLLLLLLLLQGRLRARVALHAHWASGASCCVPTWNP
jgi:hypothetical protein